MIAALLGDDAMGWKVRSQTLHYQALGSAIGFRYQVGFAFQFECDALFEIGGKQGARLTRNVDGGFQIRGQLGLRAFLDQVLDIVLEDKKIGLTRPRDADE